MSYTVTVLSKSSDNQGNKIVAMHFDDGNGNTYDVNAFVPLGAASTFLADYAADMIAKLTAQQSVMAVAPEIGAPIVPTTVSAVVDANASVKSAFLADYLLLKQYQAAISHGLLTNLDAGYVAQLAKVTNQLAGNKAILLPLVDVGP